MKKVFACLSTFVLMLVAFGVAMNPVAVSAAADGKFVEDPTLEEGEIPLYVMNSIFTTFPTLYDNDTVKDPNFQTGRQYYWNELKLMIPQFGPEGPTGSTYSVYTYGDYSSDALSAAGTRIYTWELDEEGNVVTKNHTRNAVYDGQVFGFESLSNIRYNVTGKDLAVSVYKTEDGISTGGSQDPIMIVFDGNGKAVRGHNHGNYNDANYIATYGYTPLFGLKDGQIVLIEDVAGAADVNGNSAPEAELDVQKITVDDLDNPLTDPVTGEQLTDDEGNPLYNQKEIDDPEGTKQVKTGKRYIWQWYSEEDFAEQKVNTVPYMAEGWLADRWDYAYPDQNGGYVCIAFAASLGTEAKISAEEAAIHNASVDALVAAGEEAPEKIAETVTTNEDGTETTTYAAYSRPVIVNAVIPADGIMYRFGYLDYTGPCATTLYAQVYAHVWEQALLYGREAEYQAYTRAYNFTGTGLAASNAVVNGESFIVREENGKLVVEVKAGATIDVSELVEITGMLGGYSISGAATPEAGSNVAAALSYKNAAVDELSYVLDIDGQHVMWAEKFKYESVEEAAAAFKTAMEASFGGAFSNWSGNANIFKLFTESDEWDWVLDYWAAVNPNSYNGMTNAEAFQKLKAGDTTIDPYFIAVEANSFSKLTTSAVYAGSLTSPNYGDAAVQEAIWDYMPAPDPYKYESFQECIDDFILDFTTWASKHESRGSFFKVEDGVPMSSYQSEWAPLLPSNWSTRISVILDDAYMKITDFFTSEDYGAKWSWFYDFYAEQVATTMKSDGTAWGYAADHRLTWRQAFQAYMCGEVYTAWPATPDFSGRSETPYWVGINEVNPTWEDAKFELGETYGVHDSFKLQLEVTNKATGFVDTLEVEFVVVEDYTPIFQIDETALEALQEEIYKGATSVDLLTVISAYDGYYDTRTENVYGHDISRYIEFEYEEGFDPANLTAGTWTIKAHIDSQVNGSSKSAETTLTVFVPDATAPVIKVKNDGIIYVPVGTPLTAEDVLQYAYDNVDGDYLNDVQVYHNWFNINTDYDPLTAKVYDEFDAVVSVTDANGMKSEQKVTIIVTGLEVELPDVDVNQQPSGDNPGTEEPAQGCIQFAYVSSFIAAAGLALLVFKKRH